HEVGPARSGLAAVENAGNVGVIHEGQGLALGLKASHHLAGVHARLEDLERDSAADRLLLLGQEDDAEAALADLLQQLLRADDRAGALAERIRKGSSEPCGRGLEKPLVLVVYAEQALDACPQARVLTTLLLDVTAAGFRRRDTAGGVEDGFFIGLRYSHGPP